MPAHLFVALSLAASLTAEVPYLPQTSDLCGGAAVAMVFRYWGDAHADIEQFAPLVDRKAGGIPDDVLVEAVTARGWDAVRFDGSLELLRERLQKQQPIIVLLRNRRDRYHYVVVTAMQPAAVVVHDPSWGPSRSIRLDDFQRRWSAAHFWSLVIVPRLNVVGADLRVRPAAPSEVMVRRGADTSVGPYNETGSADRCSTLLDRGIEEVRTRGLDMADEILGRVRAECPAAAGPLRELAGVRFAEHRWTDAVALARAALHLDASDTYALDVLGSSLFMLDDPVGALRAWNEIGRPRLDIVRVEGLRRTRYASIVDVVGARPSAVLTADAFAMAARRINELPDRASARLTLRPGTDGFATLDATIAEHTTVPRDPISWASVTVRAAVDREAALSLPGFTGQGEIWTASWRWWMNRPRVALAFTSPRFAGLPGIWRVDAAWETQTFAIGSSGAPALMRESHAHGGIKLSDWLTPDLRYAIRGGLDVWDASRKAASIGGSIDWRLLDDRLSLGVDATKWLPAGAGRGFEALGTRVIARAPSEHRTWTYVAAAGAEYVSSNAPIGLWPGAGDGRARTPLLRAHPLLTAGVIDATGRSAFGRSLACVNAEAQRWLERPQLVPVGVAGFVDSARGWRTNDPAPARIDVGAGLRVKIPASDRVLRIDIAHGLTDRAKAFTVGWAF